MNYFQKGNYAFNINKLYKDYACVTPIDLNVAINSFWKQFTLHKRQLYY